jgi:hypothetical protein
VSVPERADGSLVDVLDALIDEGVVLGGDVVLGVADIDLVRLQLHALLAGVQEVGPDGMRGRRRLRRHVPRRVTSRPDVAVPGMDDRVDIADDPARGLGELVVAVLDLLKQLMERQALRRLDDGTLRDDQVDRLAETFLALDAEFERLRDQLRAD